MAWRLSQVLQRNPFVTIARRYVLLQRIVWIQSVLCIVLSLYVLVKHKKTYPLNVNIKEAPALDLSFLDLVTNRTFQASTLSTRHPSAPVAAGVDAEGVSRQVRLPLSFDHYAVVGGIPAVAVGGRVLRVGDDIHGRLVESVSPLGVIVGGEFYTFNERNVPQ